jgi:site-specific DNA-methyltransferase (cytosine-N4-specific)
MGPTDVIGDDVRLYRGCALAVLPTLAAGSARCCVTSPPYWGGLRDYGHPAQLGLEREPAEYAARLLEVFGEVRRVLADDGSLWLNLGDAYAAAGKGGGGSAGKRGSWDTVRNRKGFRMPPPGYKQKDLTLYPFLVADALRRAGWYLRQAVVWEKPAAAEPERADRPSVCHEYLFLFAKSERYAVANPGEPWWAKSVWRIAPDVNPDHPATMPEELVRRCVVCSSKPGDVVMDPFAGSGTVGKVAVCHDRRAVLVELNEGYYATALARLRHAAGHDAGQLFSVLGGGG